MRRIVKFMLSIASLLAVAACATTERGEAPKRPVLVGDQPAIGKSLDLNLIANGQRIRLQGVVGRVTLLCVLDTETEHDLAASCEELADQWQDRITVVGLALDEAIIEAWIPFRTYYDPEGAALQKNLELEAAPRIVLVDKQGRVARLFQPSEIGAVGEGIERLAF